MGIVAAGMALPQAGLGEVNGAMQANGSGRIARRVIQADAEDYIVVRKGEACTVTMPGVIESMDGSGFSTDPQTASSFLMSYTPGRNYFSIEALKSAARNNLNVVVGGQVYVLVFQESDKDNLYSVIYSNAPVLAMDDPKPKPAKPISTARMLSLLDKTKAYALLARERPEIVQDLRVSYPYTITAHENYDVRTRMVVRDDAIDALAFEVELIPKGDKPLPFDPEGFVVSVGGKNGNPSRVYYQVLGDSTGRMEPNARNLAYFLIAGDGYGGRNNLDVFNRFEISVDTLTSRISPDPPIDPMPLDYAEGPKLKPTPTPKPSVPLKPFLQATPTPSTPTPTPTPTPAPRNVKTDSQPSLFEWISEKFSGERKEPTPTVKASDLDPMLRSAAPEPSPDPTPRPATPTPTPAPTITPTPQPSVTQPEGTPVPTAMPRLSPKLDSAPTMTPTPTPEPTATPTPAPDFAPKATPTERKVKKATSLPTPTPRPQLKATPIPTPTPVPTSTPKPQPKKPEPTPTPIKAVKPPNFQKEGNSEIYETDGVIQYDSQIEIEIK